MRSKPPSYRQRPGYTQALVTLTDAVTKQRRDYWLGEHGSPQSRELYHQILAEWEANGRRLPDPLGSTEGPAAGITVAEVMLRYWRSVQGMYSGSEVNNIGQGIKITRQLFGSTPAEAFGPKRLRMVRDAMVRGDPNANPPRVPWSRPHVNKQIRRLAAIFKWAAGQELISISVFQSLKAVESLKRGRTTAREPAPVGPVADDRVDGIQPFVSRQVWALIELQRLTGARGGELFKLRRKDIDTSGDVWTYTLADHKTAHHGKTRTIYLGPRAQAIIHPFLLDRPVDAFLFSPADAERERREQMHANRTTPLSCGNRPGTNRCDEPQRGPRDHYTRDTYHTAIQRACDAAFPPPPELARQRVPAHGRKTSATRWETSAEWKKRLGERWADLKAWQRDHRWHPHQLRHSAGTRIRRDFGLEAAQIALGHSSALVTDAVYAERDMAKAIEVMKRIG